MYRESRIKEYECGLLPDPDPSLASPIIESCGVGLDQWLALRDRQVVFWGWHKTEINTMVFEHESIRRAFHLLGFQTNWFPSTADFPEVIRRAPGPKIYITGECFADSLSTVYNF